MASAAEVENICSEEAIESYKEDLTDVPADPIPSEPSSERSNNASANVCYEPVVTASEPLPIHKDAEEPDTNNETLDTINDDISEKLNHSPTEQEQAMGEDGACRDETSQEEARDDTDSHEGTERVGDERIASIEEEYIQRITCLDQRHFELEDVLTRLSSAIELSLTESGADVPSPETTDMSSPEIIDVDGDAPDVEPSASGETERPENGKEFARRISFELFVEFHQKIRQFAADLNGVLSCSEAAIRHARVVQEWATSVQMMFEQIKEERQRILNYIDEREKNMLSVKEQFIEELQEQGRQLHQLVEEMKSQRELREQGEEYCRSKYINTDDQKPLAESVIDVIMKRRMDEERSIILDLSKQSKISEMKLFIIHQQNCIQQLQEQNRELKAIIEGLMGPEDFEDDDTDMSGTPASGATPDRCPVRDALERHGDQELSLVSDVLYCDRGEYLPGTSTDGDLASIQTHGIGRDSENVAPGEHVVFDPLSVEYVREQCRHAEDTERRVHEAENIQPDVVTYETSEEDSDSDIAVIEDTMRELTVEPDQPAPSEDVMETKEDFDAAGDRPDLSADKMTLKPPPTNVDVDVTSQGDCEENNNVPEIEVTEAS